MNLFDLNEQEYLAFILVLIRVATFFATWPVFGGPNVPARVKILLSLALALSLSPFITQTHTADLGSMHILQLAARETVVGVGLGFLCRLFFFVITMAGDLISLSMGLSQARLFNPAIGEQSSAVEQFYVILATLLFLGINGHHYLIGGLVQSFELIPLSAQFMSAEALGKINEFVPALFEVGVKMAAPAIVTILFMNIAMGLVGRAVPQINVLITSLPLNVLVGLMIMIVSIPLVITQMEGLAGELADSMLEWLKVF